MVKCLELSPIDQNLILIGYEKGVIVLWDLDRGLPSKNYPASVQDCQQVSEVSEYNYMFNNVYTVNLAKHIMYMYIICTSSNPS